MPPATALPRQRALRFIVFLGMVSLFADATYEGARSITGPYLGLLGASAVAVGVVSGAGELIGYTLRLFSGYLADRTRRYWTLTILGYSLNLAAVPLLALASRWEIAAALIVVERTGKAIRTPARDAMLSHAASSVGHGWAFGLHEAMDQIGALLGPLVIAAALRFGGGYRAGLAALAVPAALALITLAAAQRAFPRPVDLAPRAVPLAGQAFPRIFWVYMAATGLMAAGFADFPLIAYHLKKAAITPEVWIPLLYAAAMGVDAVAALVFGRLFDRAGVRALAPAAFFSAWAAPLAFLTGGAGAVAGIALWGVGMGAQESILRAAVAAMVPPEQRGSGYGVFNAGYGLCWFAGSALMGLLYGLSPGALAAFSTAAQLAAIPLLLWVGREAQP